MDEAYMPTISIGMPIYNSQATLRGTIESILSQDFKNWKLYISDNHSTDATMQICQEYAWKDSRITYVRQRENIGAWNNFLYVFQNSSSEYFKFQAGDDLLSKDYLRLNILELEIDKKLVGSTSPDCWDWEFQENMTQIDFELKGDAQSRLKSLRENCWRSNGMFYAIFRRVELEKVFTEQVILSRIAIKDWLLLAKLARIGDVKRTFEGLMILGSKGASNSGDLTWLTQFTKFNHKLFPYLGFYGLVFEERVLSNWNEKLQVLLWLGNLYLGHYKGLISYFSRCVFHPHDVKTN
jgi:glycosyltransferase involved in cell wall biosynthesis